MIHEMRFKTMIDTHANTPIPDTSPCQITRNHLIKSRDTYRMNGHAYLYSNKITDKNIYRKHIGFTHNYICWIEIIKINLSTIIIFVRNFFNQIKHE